MTLITSIYIFEIKINNSQIIQIQSFAFKIQILPFKFHVFMSLPF